MKMKMKNRSHRYDINRPRCRHGYEHSKYKKRVSMMMLISTPKTVEAQFMRKLSNTETCNSGVAFELSRFNRNSAGADVVMRAKVRLTSSLTFLHLLYILV